MVEDEALVGEACGELGGDGEMAGINKDVVGKIEFGESGNAAEKVGMEEEAVVGLALDNVADADEMRIESELGEIVAERGRAEIDPANDAGDERESRGEFEQPKGFLNGLASLNGNAALKTGGEKKRMKIRGEEVAAKRGEGVVDPGVFEGIVAPEVLMSVNAHGRASGPAHPTASEVRKGHREGRGEARGDSMSGKWRVDDECDAGIAGCTADCERAGFSEDGEEAAAAGHL